MKKLIGNPFFVLSSAVIIEIKFEILIIVDYKSFFF